MIFNGGILKKIKFLLINSSSPVWRVEGNKKPKGSRYLRFSMPPSLGIAWVLRQFFTRRRIIQRVWRSLRYLHPATILRAVVPVNLGYRHRLNVDGTFGRGDGFMKSAE
jgi:hypothetical protein